MAAIGAGLWQALSAAGGAAALTLIVALALGIGALTLFFLGSSVVVLQGFARGARRPGLALLMVVVWACLAAALAASAEEAPPLPPALSGVPPVVVAAASGVVLVGVAAALCAALLRLLSPGTLARGSLVLLGLGYALGVGGTDRLAYAAAPAIATLVGAGLARLRRSRGDPAGEVERGLWLLSAVLFLGVGIALALDEPRLEVAAAGAALLRAFVALVALGLLPLAAAGFLGARRGAEWFIAVRYLLAKRRQTFISVISAICVGGVAAGVWLIITVLSVMNGFQQVWRDEIVGKRAHLTVQSGLGNFADYKHVLAVVESEPDVIGAAPFLDAEGMIRGAGGQIHGVRIRGVDPARVGQVTTLEQDVVAGSLAGLTPGASGDGRGPPDAPGAPLPGIALGSDLAASLGLDVGDTVMLVSPFGGPPTPFGPAPRLYRFRVAAIFRSSFMYYDELYTYVNLAAAQEFLGTDDVVQGIEVRVRDVYRSRALADAIQQKLGFPFYARDWKEFFPAFFQALKTEQVMMFVLLTMIMVVAAFVIVATLIMMIMEKTSDIAILKAMGAEDAAIERIFAIEGTLIGLVGTALGVVAGIVVTKQLPWIQHQVEALTGIDTLPASVYQGISTLPSRIDPLQVAAIVAIAMILSLGATLLPSRQGARLDPAEALRYE